MLSKNMNITAIIILYNSNIKNSQTVECLLKADKAGIKIHAIIWNNGPNLLTTQEQLTYSDLFCQQNVELSIYEDTRNIALSKIYNQFINQEHYDFFTILDQDSNLDTDFFQNIKNNNTFDIIVPAIYSSGWRSTENTLCFPVYSDTDDLLDKTTFSMGEIKSISSGLTISSRLIKQLKKIKKDVFNIQYALYAIDTSFFLDLKKLAGSELTGLCIGRINHSLDFNLKDPSKITPSRKLEMEYSNILNKLFYSNKSTINIFFYLLRKLVRKEYSRSVFITLVKCLVNKKHPRSKIPISINRTL